VTRWKNLNLGPKAEKRLGFARECHLPLFKSGIEQGSNTKWVASREKPFAIRVTNGKNTSNQLGRFMDAVFLDEWYQTRTIIG
jgi:hypothetical protein